MEFLVAMDLEGIHGVVGRPNEKLSKDTESYAIAKENALIEANTAIAALFDAGADKVLLWDNHGGGNNVDTEKVDPRAIQVFPSKTDKHRFDFVQKHHFDGILLLGYHSREGTLGGVLAHTYNSGAIQYVKLNGKPIGEIETDAYICAAHGIPVLFLSSDDVCIRQATETLPNITTVITKFGKSRNEAELKDRETVLSELSKGIRKAVLERTADMPLYPFPATLEIRYTRMERAAELYKKAQENEIPVAYGEDAHILIYTVNEAKQIPFLI